MRTLCFCSCLALVALGCGEDDSVASNAGDGGTGNVSSGGTGGVTDSGSGGTATGGTGGAPPGPPTIARVGDTFAVPSVAESAPKRFCDVAHDSVHDVYAIVNGNAATSISLVNADGTSLGAPQAVAQTTAWTQGQSITFGDADTGFLVAWHDTRENPNLAKPRGRLVKTDGTNIVFAGDDFALDGDASFGEAPPGSAFSTTQKTFLVAWQAQPGDDIHARLVNGSGPLGNELVVTNDPDWQSDVSVAYNPERDEFLLAWTHAGGGPAEVRAQRVKASDGSLVGSSFTVGSASGTWLARTLFVPSEHAYVVAWFGGAVAAQRVDQDGALVGDPFPLAAGYGAYDGFSVALSPVTGNIAAAMHGPSDEDFAVAFNAAGEESAVIQATDEAGDEGHFNPRITAHSTRAEWLLVTSRGFAEVVAQRLGP